MMTFILRCQKNSNVLNSPNLVRLLHSTYIIKPNTTAQEQEKQACYLTNTILQDGMPPSYGLHTCDRSEEFQKLVDSIRSSIIEVNYFHRDKEVEITKRTTERKKIWRRSEFNWKIAEPLLQNFLRIVWSSKQIRFV